MEKHTTLIRALMDDYDRITLYFSTHIDGSAESKMTLLAGNRVLPFSVGHIIGNSMVLHTEKLDVRAFYQVTYDQEKEEVIPYHVLDKPEFHYPGSDLGLTYTKEQTTFKVFAPTAMRVTLHLYKTLNTEKRESFPLIEEKCGVWSVTLDRDLKGWFYNFTVAGALSLFDEHRTVIDPYAPCVIGKTGKALIIDLKDYPATIPAKLLPLQDSILYEIHLRDISIDSSSGCQHNGKYLALTEENTYLNGSRSTFKALLKRFKEVDEDATIKTGLSHIKELGINTVQIMPLQEFDNEQDDPLAYGWGYMPRFYNTPTGYYASNWRTDAKITELKTLINHLHQHDIRVILDVVYNHTAEGFTNERIFSFNGFVPYFYYRLINGDISNGSGCGNELRTETFMGRKFILDSLKFWTSYYGFDGYRFDLMGLIDFETIRQTVHELRQLKPDILLYGEPWTAGATPLHAVVTKGVQRHQGFSVFNDDFRDALKGSVFARNGKGFIQTEGHWHYDNTMQGILGSINAFAASPVESINYVEVHDNNTLFDKLYFSLTDQENFAQPDDPLLDRIVAMHKLTLFILLMSYGIPLLHLGQDFLRTKSGDANSYMSGDAVNQIDWQRKKTFYKVFSYYKTLIQIRKKYHLLRIASEPEIRDAIDFNWEHFPPGRDQGIAYVLDNGRRWGDSIERLLILINPYQTEVTLHLRDQGWKKLLIGDAYFAENHPNVEGPLTVPPLSGSVLYIGV